MIKRRIWQNGFGGLGDDTSTTVLNYPGMPDTTGVNNPIGTPLTPTQLAAYSAGNAAYFGAPTGALPGSFTAWLNANPTAIWWGVGLLFALAFLSEGRR